MNKTLEDLSQMIQNVIIDDDFSQILPEERLIALRCTTMYFSAALMDCLTAVIHCLTRPGWFLILYVLKGFSHRKGFFGSSKY
jgi:hypothetical protein